jgi:hypothetical protein
MTSGAAVARDTGLALISRINRWLIAGAVAVTGFLSLVAAHAFHGRTISGPNAAVQNATQPSAAPANAGGSDDSNSSGLSPSAAPAPAAPTPSAVVSGGS